MFDLFILHHKNQVTRKQPPNYFIAVSMLHCPYSECSRSTKKVQQTLKKPM